MIEVALYETDQKLTFGSIAQVEEWLKAEDAAWEALGLPPGPKTQVIVQNHKNFVAAVASAVASGDLNNVPTAFALVRQGAVFTHSSPEFPFLRTLAAADGKLFAFAHNILGFDHQRHLAPGGLNARAQEVFQSAVRASMVGHGMDSRGVASVMEEAQRLRSTQQGYVSDLAALVEAHRRQVEAFATTFQEAESERLDASSRSATARDGEWQAHLTKVEEQWAALKKVYDTELGLRAPTTYWTDREKSQRRIAIGYAGVFALLIGSLLHIFVTYGMPYLSHVGAVGKDGGGNTILAVLPILIPAFAAIWVLRIVGRLLAESLALMRDASERTTLVKTFLAMMKDEAGNKSVIKDDDRILILHALFRPSTGAVSDDSPPVHWFDLLSSRLGDKK